VADRFFAAPVTAAGETVSILLDTGDSGRFFAEAIQRLGWRVDEAQSDRGPMQVVELPLPSPFGGTRTVVGPPTDAFDTLMARHTIGQLGYDWFDGRVWTFDYGQHRLLLRESMPPGPGESEHDVPLDFRTDSAGKVFGAPRVEVQVDDDSLLMLFDTGATVWLTEAARSMLHDDQPVERAWSLVRAATFKKWRAAHPDWRVIEHANQINDADMIEVPRIRVAGFDVGPVWFGTIPDRPASAPPAPRRTHIDGTIGGSALKYFSITVDYPGRTARFKLNSTASAELRYHHFTSKVFGNSRQLRVLLPAGYEKPENRHRRYPVLYLNDGQNLFDSATSLFNPMEWQVDETVLDLERQRAIEPLIVVGIDNAGRRGRFKEYYPYLDPTLSPAEPDPRGKDYPQFLVDEVKPFIDRHYRTLPDADHTGIGGSSAGALAAIYAAIRRPAVFGRLLIESPSVYVDNHHIFDEAQKTRQWPARIYIGVGTNESNRDVCPASTGGPGTLVDDVHKFVEVLRADGVEPERILQIVVPCGRHDEQAWAARLRPALQFLYPPEQSK
jgi:predicted alpha/beta superfamily hydrolase